MSKYADGGVVTYDESWRFWMHKDGNDEVLIPRETEEEMRMILKGHAEIICKAMREINGNIEVKMQK